MTCPFRKSYPDVLMMQSGQDGKHVAREHVRGNLHSWRCALAVARSPAAHTTTGATSEMRAGYRSRPSASPAEDPACARSLRWRPRFAAPWRFKDRDLRQLAIRAEELHEDQCYQKWSE